MEKLASVLLPLADIMLGAGLRGRRPRRMWSAAMAPRVRIRYGTK